MKTGSVFNKETTHGLFYDTALTIKVVIVALRPHKWPLDSLSDSRHFV